MPKLLEVIVTSRAEAVAAEAGGADRLELIRDFAQGGLTPDCATVEEVLQTVAVPVRVMLRENSSMAVGSEHELQRLCSQATALAKLPLEGLVLGFINDGTVDGLTMERVLGVVGSLSVTFHRAFESLHNPEAGLIQLLDYPQIDRVLVRLGEQFSIEQLEHWQDRSAGRIRFIAGLGLSMEVLQRLAASTLTEVHVGRLARVPAEMDGRVDAGQIRALKSVLS